MQSGLSIKFNHKAKKEVMSEDGLKVGVRRRSDGSLMHVRGGKIVGESQQPKAETTILNELRQAAAEAVAKQNKVSQEHHKPSSVKPERPPRL